MSRTFRRKNASRKWYQGLIAEYQFRGDMYCHGENLKSNVKIATNSKRRSWEREILSKLIKGEQEIPIDLEKKYLGEIWNWD